jgi:hypothetical protein
MSKKRGYLPWRTPYDAYALVLIWTKPGIAWFRKADRTATAAAAAQ